MQRRATESPLRDRGHVAPLFGRDNVQAQGNRTRHHHFIAAGIAASAALLLAGAALAHAHLVNSTPAANATVATPIRLRDVPIYTLSNQGSAAGTHSSGGVFVHSGWAYCR